jgi:acetyl esterase/lipase
MLAVQVARQRGHRRRDDRLSLEAVDPQRAVRWLPLHAGELRVDPSDIFVLDDATGAQIALYVAAVGHTVAGDDAAALPCVSSSNRSQLGHNVAAPQAAIRQRRPIPSGRSRAHHVAAVHNRRENAAGNDRARS